MCPGVAAGVTGRREVVKAYDGQRVSASGASAPACLVHVAPS